MKSCPTCATPVAEDAAVCPDCGMDLSTALPSHLVEVAVSAPNEVLDEAPLEAVTLATTATLTLLRGSVMAEAFAIGGEAVVGRFDASSGPVDVDLSGLPEAGWVSRRHARLYCGADGQWWIQDLGSSNGTFVRANGRGAFHRVSLDSEHPLQAGDEIALGNARFSFLIND